MRIAHINNMANIAWGLAQAQKTLGHEAVVFSVYDYPSRFPYDVAVPHARGPVFWNLAMFRRLLTFKGFDVLHIHGGIWQTQVFYPSFKHLYPRKVFAVHFHGMDARTGNGLHHLRDADLQFHSTQDLAPFVPNSEWLPSPVTVPAKVAEVDNPIPRFGHFPFRWKPGAAESFVRKGTDRILGVFRDAFGPLEEAEENGIYTFRGKEAELVIVSGRPHDEALRLMATCDVVVDQLSDLRIYGMAALEAMALGKPAMSNYEPKWFPGSPVIRLEDDPGPQLRAIAADAGLRRELGRKGREFVLAVHEARKVAALALEAYRQALERLERRRGWAKGVPSTGGR